MPNNRYRNDIQKIAQTKELRKLIKPGAPFVDKPPIGSVRGVGISAAPFSPCQTSYSSSTGVYTMQGLIDETAAPRITDGTTNSCDQLKTLLGMYEIGVSPKLTICLKPDGVFVPKNYEQWYVSLYTLDISNSAGGVTAPGGVFTWTSQHNVFFDNFTDCATMSQTVFRAETLSVYGGSFVSSAIASPISTTLTQDVITAMATADVIPSIWPVEFVNVNVTTSVNMYDNWVVTMGIPKDYTFDPYGNLPTLQYVQYEPNVSSPSPGSLSAIPTSISTSGLAIPSVAQIPLTNTFELAINAATRLWKPNASPVDPETPLKYTNGVSTIKVGFGTSRYAIITPAKDGGFMIYEVDGSSVPIGNVYVFRIDRTLSYVGAVANIPTYSP